MTTRILVLPGIGDVYWVMVKLQDWMRQQEITDPEIWVWDFDQRPRSREYIERIPFVKFGGYYHDRDKSGPEFQESYIMAGRVVYSGFRDFDYYIAFNGILRAGLTLDDAMPGVASDWFFPLDQTRKEEAASAGYRLAYPTGYIVAFFSDHGMFGHWVREWGADECAALVTRLREETNLPVLLTGSHWDRTFAAQVAERSDAVDLTCKTDADQFFALFRHAKACVGWCGGNTILSTYFRVPTVIGWHRYFQHAGFYANACPPSALGQWYQPIVVGYHQPADAVCNLLRLMARQR